MSSRATSLRLRLLTLILVPLLLISVAAGTWRYQGAKATAIEIFDRNLLAITLAVARDIAISGGDAISSATQDLLEAASGGRVFYHARGPDGSFVAGYAYPPLPLDAIPESENRAVLFDGIHQNEPVRVSRLTEATTIDGIGGYLAISVWQRREQREAFARRQALRAAAIIGALNLTVVVVVWFGIRLGLRPLDDLERSISVRRPGDMRPLMRPVPREVAGVASTLNLLFEKVRDSIEARDRFISDAAHQLRNPIAAIRTLAESAGAAHSGEEAKRRALRVAEAAKNASRLSEQLLSLESLRSNRGLLNAVRFDANSVARQAAMQNAEKILDRGVEIEFREHLEEVFVLGDPVLIGEALENLIDNALTHAGNDLSRIVVEVRRDRQTCVLTVSDDGIGIPDKHRDLVFERFVQVDHGKGSGLGLPIAREIARKHRGEVNSRSNSDGNGVTFDLVIPVADDPDDVVATRAPDDLKA